MGLAAGYEYDNCLARILPSGFCVAGHGKHANKLFNDDYCDVLIIPFPDYEESIRLYNNAIKNGKLLKIGRTYNMDLGHSTCADMSSIVDTASFRIFYDGENYNAVAIDYRGKLLVFISADITHNCRCVEVNSLSVLKMVKEVYELWRGKKCKKQMTQIDMTNTIEILKYLGSVPSLPVIDADCNGIHITTGGRIITARKRLQFKITHYVCGEKEYQLDRELKFDANITVRMEIINGILSLIEARSSDTKPVIADGERDCHENININNGEVCLGTYAKRLKINLDNFGSNLCKALEYVFNVVQSALEKPNVCNLFQNCYSAYYDKDNYYSNYDEDEYDEE